MALCCHNMIPFFSGLYHAVSLAQSCFERDSSYVGLLSHFFAGDHFSVGSTKAPLPSFYIYIYIHIYIYLYASGFVAVSLQIHVHIGALMLLVGALLLLVKGRYTKKKCPGFFGVLFPPLALAPAFAFPAFALPRPGDEFCC